MEIQKIKTLDHNEFEVVIKLRPEIYEQFIRNRIRVDIFHIAQQYMTFKIFAEHSENRQEDILRKAKNHFCNIINSCDQIKSFVFVKDIYYFKDLQGPAKIYIELWFEDSSEILKLKLSS